MADIDTLRDRVEALLADSGNVEWSTTELDQAMRLALADLSVALPVHSVTTIDAVDKTWEYSLSAVSGLVEVTEVWYPYLAGHPALKRPHPVRWRTIDDATLLLEMDEHPDPVYDLRVFFTRSQTVAGLDGAAVTTVSEAEKALLVRGCAAFAALAKSRDVTNEVTIGAGVPERLREWGLALLQRFNAGLAALSVMAHQADDSRPEAWGGEV
ncbi:MAG TPA: hypothetical protein PKW05_08030 [Anaerolineae bacterium]|nr:hypothetical protein [Anaerolineae bacterium]HQJ51709.1 hypothetical protein [Anaerolineae bacterium]